MPSDDKSGTQAFWEKGVIEQNRQWLHAYLFAAVGDFHRAADLVQETFVIAFEKRHEFDADRHFGRWLRGIARNLLREHWRERSKSSAVVSWETLEQMEDTVKSAEVRAGDPDAQARRLAALRECLGKMKDGARRLLCLH